MDLLILAIFLTLIGVLVWNVRAIRLRLEAESITGAAVLETDEVESLLELELQRARRLNYPLSVINLRLEHQDVNPAVSHAVLKMIAADSRRAAPGDTGSGVINIFRNSPGPLVTLRSTDLAVYDKQGNRFVMLLVGTGREDAERIARHVATCVSESLGYRSIYGCAEFPSDHYFKEDLLRETQAQQHAVEAPAKERDSAA